MNVFDIIILVLLAYAIWKGWSSGVLVQLSGLAGILLGTWLAHRFSERACVWFSVETEYKWLVFIAILIIVLIGVIVLCRLLTNLLTKTGMSIPIKLLGAAVSVLKVFIIVALFLRIFESVNNHIEFVDDKHLKESVSYTPLDNVASTIFPYITDFFNKTDEENPKVRKNIDNKIEKEVNKQVEKEIDKKINKR